MSNLPFWVLVTAFFLELLLLFLLSRSVINSLAKFIYTLSRSRTVTIHTLALLFLPGTILHELSHLLVAGVLFVPVGEINVLPKIDEDGVKLGTVEIGETDMLRRLIIGVAPIIVGLSVIISVLFLMKDSIFISNSLWQTLLVLYIVFEIGNSMFSSKKDLEGAAVFLGAIFTVLLIVILALYFTDSLSIFQWIENIETKFLEDFFAKIDWFLLLPLSLNISFWMLAKAVKTVRA